MAIKSLRDQMFSAKSDVKSFGIISWEIFSPAEISYSSKHNFLGLFHWIFPRLVFKNRYNITDVFICSIIDVISLSYLYDRLIDGYKMQQPKYSWNMIYYQLPILLIIFFFLNNMSLFRYNIMYNCWNMNPNSRPYFIDLTGRISDLLWGISKQ